MSASGLGSGERRRLVYLKRTLEGASLAFWTIVCTTEHWPTMFTLARRAIEATAHGSLEIKGVVQFHSTPTLIHRTCYLQVTLLYLSSKLPLAIYLRCHRSSVNSTPGKPQ